MTTQIGTYTRLYPQLSKNTYSFDYYLKNELNEGGKVIIEQKSNSTDSITNFTGLDKEVRFVFIPQINISKESRKIIENQIRQYADVWVTLSNT